jgi:regulatory protein YycH of two-component signal transduction system YycFG
MPFDVSTIFKIIEESILPNIFQNDFSSTEGVAPPKQNRNRIYFNHNPIKEALKHFIVV